MRKPQGRGLELARKHLALCRSELACVSRSVEFLRSNAYGTCLDDVEDSTTASGCKPVGFDVSLNSRLSAPTPPRSIRLLSWKKVRIWNMLLMLFFYSFCFLFSFFVYDQSLFLYCQAIEYFEKLLHDLDVICSFSLDPLLESVLHFVVQFQKSQPDLVARSHLQVYCYASVGFTFLTCNCYNFSTNM